MKIKITTADALTGHSRDYLFHGSDAVLSWAEDQVAGIDLPEGDAASTLAAALESFRAVEIFADGVRIKSNREFFGAVAAERDISIIKK